MSSNLMAPNNLTSLHTHAQTHTSGRIRNIHMTTLSTFIFYKRFIHSKNI
jgi:hypothetical protein